MPGGVFVPHEEGKVAVENQGIDKLNDFDYDVGDDMRDNRIFPIV